MRILYHYWLDPASRAIRVILTEKKIPFELLVSRFWDPQDPIHGFSRSGMPPVLSDQETVFEGLYAILSYLEHEQRADTSLPSAEARAIIWRGEDIKQRAEVSRLIDLFQGAIYFDVIRVILNEKLYLRLRKQHPINPHVLNQAFQCLTEYLKNVEGLLSTRNWLAGNKMTWADLIAGAYLSVLDYLGDINWASWPLLKEWYICVKCRPSFQILLNDKVPGLPASSWYNNLDF